jgi:hypothetical protein
VTSTITAYPAGSTATNVNCVLDQGTDAPVDCTEPDGGAIEIQVYANAFHGTVATFTFHGTETGCTYTLGWWKNKGAADAAAFDFDGGTNNGLSVLNTAPRGNPYIILAHQYIAASLNSANGATLTGSALTAYNSATDYFAVASVSTPLAGGTYTKTQITDIAAVLDDYNNGLIGPGHCE